jgi:hypothetical protein
MNDNKKVRGTEDFPLMQKIVALCKRRAMVHERGLHQ